MHIQVFEKGIRPPEFYAFIGPVAFNRAAMKELHDQYGSLYDEPHAVWFVALGEAGECLGFCALFDQDGKDMFFDHCYVLPAHRNQGVGKALFAKRMDYARRIQGPRKVRGVTRNDVQYQTYLKHGFRLANKRGRYCWMELSLA